MLIDDHIAGGLLLFANKTNHHSIGLPGHKLTGKLSGLATKKLRNMTYLWFIGLGLAFNT